MAETIAMAHVDAALLKQFDTSDSAYRFYPAPSRFIEAFGAEEYTSWLRKRGIGGFARSLALYIHTPCSDDSNLSLCALPEQIRKKQGSWFRYLEYLKQEAHLLSGLLDDRSLVQIHWGNTLPAYLDHAELHDLRQALARDFAETKETEHWIDVDPRHSGVDKIAILADLGFDRISIGSTALGVQETVRPEYSQIDVINESVIKAARASGFNSINIDLYYGLPEQTLMSFNHSLQKAIALAPERIAVLNHAHLPRPPGQRNKAIDFKVPDIDARIQFFSLAVTRLCDAGYVYLGLDYFAKPNDELAVAQRQGRLHLNCQGFLIQPDCDVLGLGVAAISMVGPTYCQNARTLDDYYERLEEGRLPVMRGIELTADDLARRTVMHALMCHFEVAFESVEIAYLLDFREYFSDEIRDLGVFVDAGLVHIDDKWLAITDKGRYVVRVICQVFDRYLRKGRERASFSKEL